jgi:hypothetical protein
MRVSHQPMQPHHIPECVELIASHPVVGPRYGKRVSDLGTVWARLLHSDAQVARVLHAGEGPAPPICCVGFSVFVTDEFVREMKRPPGFWVGPELSKRILEGRSPVLSDSQVLEANSRGGLNLLVWEGCVRREFETESDVHRTVMIGFIEAHRGYLWKELISSQLESADRLLWTIKTGGLWWNPRKRCYTDVLENPREIVQKPHVVGITREIEVGRQVPWANSWVGTLFQYQVPKCGFSRREQKMLSAALASDSGTDLELSRTLGVSLPTVKKVWLSVYERAADHLPEILPNSPRPQSPACERGREKRRRLLAYLREHPEELRPFSQKIPHCPSELSCTRSAS